MPKPFWYYVDFVDSPTTQEERKNNLDSIRGYILGNDIEITPYALAAIIATAGVLSAYDPSYMSTSWHYDRWDEGVTYPAYGFWLYDSSNITAENQVENLIITLKTGVGYIPTVAPFTAQEFCNSGDNNNLVFVLIQNYSLGDWPKPEFSDSFLQECIRQYENIKTYILTTAPRLSPVAISILKKHKKRWWK